MLNFVKLIKIFKDTINLFNNNDNLKTITKVLQENTKVFTENFNSMIRNEHLDKLDIVVEENTTFKSAKKHIITGKKIAVLNFANPHMAGGGVTNGAMAQEECLCRSSNLYLSLITEKANSDYYKYNRKKIGNVFTDRVIYSPNVMVIKSDDTYPEIMAESDYFNVDVITCAAPITTILLTDKQKKSLEYIFYNRIKNIFEVAMYNQVDILILGAFGCGAFNNPPDLVANVFRRLLVDERYQNYFTKVVFAIKPKGNSKNCPNISAFTSTFKNI